MQRFIYSLIVVLGIGIFPLSQVLSAKEVSSRIILLPFEVSEAGKYAVLKDALGNMVATRLATQKGVTVVENTIPPAEQKQFLKVYPKNADAIFKRLGADRLGAGKLMAIGPKLIMHMRFYSAKGTPPVVVEVEAQSELAVMGAVDRLLVEIDEKVYGKSMEAETAAERPLLTQRAGMEAFRTEHPDRKYKEEIITGSAVFLNTEGKSISRNTITRRMSTLSEGLVGLDVADADGNGVEEIVVASLADIRVFRFEKGILKQLSKVSLPPDIKPHSMNLADLDGDGRSEIYLSCAVDKKFSSLVYSWAEKGGFKLIMKDIRWAIRPMHVPELGHVLVGQRISREAETFLEPGLYVLEIDLKQGAVKKGEQLSLPGSFNLFDFIFADIDGDGNEEKVAITSRLRLAVYDKLNRPLWRSDAIYGGSVSYFGSRWRAREGKDHGFMTHDDENYLELQYVPVQLVAQDVNGDGKMDIVAAQNFLSTFKALSNLRSFKGGHVVCLGWNGAAMAPLWETDILDGYIADIYFDKKSGTLDMGEVEDTGADGQGVRLVVGQVPNDGFASILNLFDNEAKLVVYEFKIIEKKNEEKK